MPGLDTNVLVRLLVRDDEAQSAMAREAVEAALAGREALTVTRTVVLETEWVLRSRYGFGKTVVLSTLRALLESRDLSFEAEGAIEYACHLYEHHLADFADCLHVACYSAEGALPMLTFDKQAGCLPGAAKL